MMRLWLGALLCAAQVAAVPAGAAELIGDQALSSQRQGAFAGARLRVPLGAQGDSKPRAGLALAPLAERQGSDGSRRTRFSAGLELGFDGRRDFNLAFAGTPVSQLAQGRTPEGRRQGVSTVGWVVIGVSAVAIVTAAVLYAELTDDCGNCD